MISAMTSLETFFGYIHTTEDAMLIFEACRSGLLHKVSRRLTPKERRELRSGSVFIFDEHESGIRRWTDGRMWSPSRILVYREVERKEAAPKNLDEYNYPSGSIRGALTKDETEEPSGPLTSQKGTYYFKHGGLIKKTISIFISSTVQYHMVCYYNKFEVESGLIKRPNCHPLLRELQVPEELMNLQNFRKPQKSIREMKREERNRRSGPYFVEDRPRRVSDSNSSNHSYGDDDLSPQESVRTSAQGDSTLPSLKFVYSTSQAENNQNNHHHHQNRYNRNIHGTNMYAGRHPQQIPTPFEMYNSIDSNNRSSLPSLDLSSAVDQTVMILADLHKQRRIATQPARPAPLISNFNNIDTSNVHNNKSSALLPPILHLDTPLSEGHSKTSLMSLLSPLNDDEI